VAFTEDLASKDRFKLVSPAGDFTKVCVCVGGGGVARREDTETRAKF
jgi:hypothetical protein